MENHKLISEKDWYVSFPLECSLDRLKAWAHTEMSKNPGTKITSGEHDNAYWWGTECPPELKQRLEKICPLRPMGNHGYGPDHDWNTYIWESPEGGHLNKHSDGEGRGTTFMVLLEGEFKITTYDFKFPDQALDSYTYKPGEVFALKCGHRRYHDGETLTNYRLAIAVYNDHPTDPFRDHWDGYRPWWGERTEVIHKTDRWSGA